MSESFSLEYAAMRQAVLYRLRARARDIPEEDRLELVDAIMLKAWLHWPKIACEDPGRRYAWLFAVAATTVVDWRRAQMRRPLLVGDDVLVEVAADSCDDGLDVMRNWVQRRLPWLSPRQRAAIQRAMVADDWHSLGRSADRKDRYAAIRRLRGLVKCA